MSVSCWFRGGERKKKKQRLHKSLNWVKVGCKREKQPGNLQTRDTGALHWHTRPP